jgi:Double zinc ribbon
VSSGWNERMRLIRLRRKKERPRFSEELRVIPKWLVWLVVGLYLLAQGITMLVNLTPALNHGIVRPEELGPVAASFAMAGLVTLVAFPIACFLLMLGYVYRDARRRNMNAPLWTLLVFILSPSSLFIGLIIYLLVREPLPYSCPKCGALVGPRFNFCSNCKCDLHPSCPNCKREIVETDKFCPYCAQELAGKSEPSSALSGNAGASHSENEAGQT